MIRLADIAARLGLEFRGDAGRMVSSMASLCEAGSEHLSIFTDKRYLADLHKTAAGVVLLSPEHASECQCDCLLAEEPYLQFARVSALFVVQAAPESGIHPDARIADGAAIHATASIGPGVIVGPNVELAAGVVVEAGCFIGADCRIGAGSTLGPRVTLYPNVWLGTQCEVQAGTVLGSEGFGYARSDHGWEKIHHQGGVRIGDKVHIGAACTIDRGSLEHTVIGDGVIIDNQVQIAHNCRIGKNTAIAGCAALAGGSIIGADCTLAGGVGVVGHANLCDGVHITAMTLVTRSISEPGSYSTGTPLMPTREWKRSAVSFRRLHKPRGGSRGEKA